MKRRGRTDLYLILALIVLAAILGAVLWRGRPDLTAAERERARIENRALAEKLAVEVRQKETLSSWIVAGKVALGVIGLGALAVGVLVAGAYGLRKALTIGPNEAGLFPLVVGRNTGAWEVRDPNRSASGVTVMGRQLALPSGAQLTVTSQAQAVQALAARYRHAPVIAPGRPGSDAPAGDHADVVTPEVAWPREIPLTGVLRDIGGPSLDRLVIGETITDGRRELVTAPMSQLVHIVAAGVTGSGKTTFVKSLLYQLVTCPENPSLAIVDMKRELSVFSPSERLLWPVTNKVGPAIGVFHALAQELHKRLELFEQAGNVSGLGEYNDYAKASGLEALRPIVLVADECAVLIKRDKAVVDALQDLALLGRSAACWLILCSQSVKVKFMPSEIREQMRTKAQFAADSKQQARVLMGKNGAEELRDPGRALVRLPGRFEDIEVQTPIVAEGSIKRVLAGQRGPVGDIPVVDVTPQDDIVYRVLEAFEKHGTKSGAAREVFGSAGGNDYYKTIEILKAHGKI